MDDGAHERGSGLAESFRCIVGPGGGGQRYHDIRFQGFNWRYNYWSDN